MRFYIIKFIVFDPVMHVDDFRKKYMLYGVAFIHKRVYGIWRKRFFQTEFPKPTFFLF